MNGAQLRAKMHGGEAVYGTMINVARNLRGAAVFGQLGFDFAIVDTEHSPNGRSETADAAASYLAAGVCPLIRVPTTEPHGVVMALDAGFHGVLVPYCETAEEVRAIVASARLRPLKGVLHRRARDQGQFPSDATRTYLEKRNADVVIVIGIESVPALENLEEILAVDGVDALFVGPNDLSVSLGIPDQYDDPRYVEAVDRVVSVAQSHGVPAGPHCFTEDQLSLWHDKGARFVMYSSDWRALGEGHRMGLSKVRGRAIGPVRRPA
jgi:2-keto-3-deoxy-L-rhamnonate aldolase RhmA